MLDISNSPYKRFNSRPFSNACFLFPSRGWRLKYTERTLLPTMRPHAAVCHRDNAPARYHISSLVHIGGILALNGSSENSSAEQGYPISNFSSTLGCRIPSLPISTSVPLPGLVFALGPVR
jgi:hypothetical protein